MKYSSKQYAVALHEAIKGKEGNEMKLMIGNFFELAKKNRDLGLMDKIISEFDDYAMKKEGILKGEIFFARRQDAKTKNSIEKKIKNSGVLGKEIKEILFEERSNEDLIGGFTARIGDIFIDASIKGTLDGLKRELQSSINNIENNLEVYKN